MERLTKPQKKVRNRLYKHWVFTFGTLGLSILLSFIAGESEGIIRIASGVILLTSVLSLPALFFHAAYASFKHGIYFYLYGVRPTKSKTLNIISGVTNVCIGIAMLIGVWLTISS